MENSQSLCTIYLVRHGQTEWNVKKLIQGQVDSNLTEKGKTDALERAKELRHIEFEAIFSSDLGRAMQTAELLKLERKLAVNTTKLLRERAYGHMESAPVEEWVEQNKKLLAEEEALAEKGNSEFVFYKGYETDAEVVGRAITFLREVSVTYLGKKVLVVSHGALLRTLLIHLGYGSLKEMPHFSGAIGNLGYVVLESDGVDFFIKETKGINKVKSNE